MDKTPIVQKTKQGSPAFRAGLFPGDRLLEVGGERVESIDHLKDLIGKLDTTDVSICFQRGEHTYTTPLQLGQDKKIGASFTEGVSDVTEVWGREELNSLPSQQRPKSTILFNNPFPKTSRSVRVFKVLGWFSLLGLVAALADFFGAESEEAWSGWIMFFSFIALSCFFFAQHLKVAVDSRWMIGETLKAMKNDRDVDPLP